MIYGNATQRNEVSIRWQRFVPAGTATTQLIDEYLQNGHSTQRRKESSTIYGNARKGKEMSARMCWEDNFILSLIFLLNEIFKKSNGKINLAS